MPGKRKETRRNSYNMWKRQKIPSKLTQKEIEDVEALFSKQHKYKTLSLQPESFDGAGHSHALAATVEDWIGEDPTLTRQVTPDQELMRLKQELNATKDQLSSKDIETWHEHTTNCNLAVRVIPHVKRLKVELCTQAWVKFYEILSTFQIVPQQAFLSVHLCEAPGAFVTALNHFLQQHEFNHMWDWRATTLNPYYEANTMGEMIADDRLIRHTYSQWFFGRDGSGDITAENHVRDLCSLVHQVKEDEELSPLLVTADGSKDCQINPAEQESLLFRLHYCEMICASLILAQGGSFVLKVFTMLEPASLALMFLLNIMFSEVRAIKPATSKSGNSEMYLVCLDYRKNVREATLWKLLDLTVYSKSEGTVNFIKDLPADFLLEHHLCCQSFARWQIQTIQQNIELFENMKSDLRQKLNEMQEMTLEKYVNLTGLSHMLHYRRIAESYWEKSAVTIKFLGGQPQTQTRPDWHHKNLKGTFHLRQNLSSMPWEERVRLMETRQHSHPNMILQCSESMKNDEVGEWMEIEMGSAVSVIENSRLCDLDLMKDLSFLLRHSDFKKSRQLFAMEHAATIGKMLSGLVKGSCTNPASSPNTTSPTTTSSNTTSLNSSNSVIYWVGRTHEKDAPVYKSFIENFKSEDQVKHIVTEEDFASVGSSQYQEVQVICNVTAFDDNELCFQYLGYEELATRRMLLEMITKLLKHLTRCHRLILLTSTFLSRLAAGIVYILVRSFHTTTMCGESNMWLHQCLVLEDFDGVSSVLLDHLADANKIVEDEVDVEKTTVLEVVKFSCLLNDRKFVQFVTACNNFTVTGFINEMIQHYRMLHQCDG